MKYYENLDLVERKKLVLRTVAFSSALEGMNQSKQECLEELLDLEEQKASAANRRVTVSSS